MIEPPGEIEASPRPIDAWRRRWRAGSADFRRRSRAPVKPDADLQQPERPGDPDLASSVDDARRGDQQRQADDMHRRRPQQMKERIENGCAQSCHDRLVSFGSHSGHVQSGNERLRQGPAAAPSARPSSPYQHILQFSSAPGTDEFMILAHRSASGYAASRTTTHPAPRCGKTGWGMMVRSGQGAVEFQLAALHVIVGRYQPHRLHTVVANPGRGLGGIADRIAGLVAQGDAAVQQIAAGRNALLLSPRPSITWARVTPWATPVISSRGDRPASSRSEPFRPGGRCRRSERPWRRSWSSHPSPTRGMTARKGHEAEEPDERRQQQDMDELTPQPLRAVRLDRRKLMRLTPIARLI